MNSDREFYLMDVADLPVEVFRGGNASGFQFHEARALKDCETYTRDGVTYVRATHNGFSCYDHITDVMKRQGRNVWKIKKGASIPAELALYADRRPGYEGHFMLPPRKDMSLKRYIGILEELERDPSRCAKLTPAEIQNG